MRIIVRLLAGQEVEKSSSIFIKTDSKGCPVIIPKFIRDFILINKVNPNEKKRMIGALITILSISRVFPTKVKPSLNTVLDPFNGLSKTIDSSLLIKSLKELKLYKAYNKNDRCTLYWSEASGPNTVISGFGSINDAFALLHTPKQLILVLKTLLFRLNIGLLLYLISILVIFGPLYLLTILFIGFNLPWKELLDIKWYPNFKIDGEIPDPVNYSVGQPMGALSSWAMLAISHHVIVKCAAIKCDLIDFKDYCILGDDVVIANDIVAKEYLNLMSTLGLSINRQKSVESFIFTEFAKKLKGYNDLDYSPIGPGLILQTIRSKAYSLKFTHELFLNKLLHLDNIKERFISVPKFFRKRVRTSLWSIMFSEYISFISEGRTFNVAFATNESQPLVRYMSSNITRFYWPLLNEVASEYVLKLKSYRVESIRFLTTIWFINLNRKGIYSLPAVFNFLNLGFYSLLISYIKSGISLIELYCKIYVLYHKDRKRIMNIEFPMILKILDENLISSVSWEEVHKVKDTSKFMTRVCSKVDNGSLVKHYLNPEARKPKRDVKDLYKY